MSENKNSNAAQDTENQDAEKQESAKVEKQDAEKHESQNAEKQETSGVVKPGLANTEEQTPANDEKRELVKQEPVNPEKQELVKKEQVNIEKREPVNTEKQETASTQKQEPANVEKQELRAAENKELPAAEIAAVSTENDKSVSIEKGESEEDLKKQMRRYSRRNFLALGFGAIGAAAGWEWIRNRPDAGGLPSSLRKAHEFNESVTQAFYSPQRLAPTFPVAEAQIPRVNGNYGVDDEDFNPAMWKLQVVGVFDPKKYPQYVSDVYYETAGEETDDSEEESDDSDNSTDFGNSTGSDNSKDSKGGEAPAEPEPEEKPEPAIPGLLLSLADIKALPRYEMVTELKCIEGWSVKVYWAGARLADFIEKFAPQTRDGSAPDVKNNPQNLVQYVSLQTPDDGYYVGLDMASAMHPQTLLCYEMNGATLPAEHGAPLVTPLKYGIKHIKRIGRITFSDERAKDFWAERGYDWYSGH